MTIRYGSVCSGVEAASLAWEPLGWQPAWFAEIEPFPAAVLAHRYELQYLFYVLALHRLLKVRLPDYDYDRHVGGALYLFLRGMSAPSGGVFAARPSREVIETLDAAFAGRKREVAA